MSALGEAFQDLLEALDRLEMHFVVGGSVASGTHGLPRLTNDIDILADLSTDQLAEFCEVLLPRFYVDEETARRALEAGRAFNVIHVKAAYKFDIFPAGQDRFAHSQLARRRYTTTSVMGLEEIEFPVSSPEDTILSKLVWYRKGREVSDRQWRDVLGVVAVQTGRLDHAYLRQWAAELHVEDLLEKVLTAN